MTGLSNIEILRFYSECGVDEVLASSPINRFKSTNDVTSQNNRTASTVRPAGQPLANNPTSSEDARSLAAECATLAELKQAIESFEGCSLKRTAKNTVFADGNPDSEIMLVGEAPGRDEDIQGLPFVGPAGQLLDRMLASIELDRSSVYISNIINWRPPGNRTPTLNEAMTCLPLIRRHIELVAPRIVVMLGGTAAKYLLDTNTGIMRLRGRWTELSLDEFGEVTVAAMPTLHPAYLLRQPAHKRLAWQDFLAIRSRINDRK